MYKPLIIRLYKRSLKLDTTYFIVVIYKSNRNRGFFLDKIGYLDFKARNSFALNTMKLAFWLNRGAKINKTCFKYLYKFVSGSYAYLRMLKKKS